MRRISTKNANEGMVLERPVFDSQGYELIESGSTIDEEVLRTLNLYGIAELIINDWRVDDVPVQTLMSPELEGMATQALRAIITESRGSKFIEDTLLEGAEGPIFQMTRELFPEVIGEMNASGCQQLNDYPFVQPAKTASLSLLMGRRLGMGMLELPGLGMAALMKDVGGLLLPDGVLYKGEPSDSELLQIRKHPGHGAEIISQLERFGPEVAEAVFYHHERWDGSGYPEGLKGEDISTSARIIGLCDSYYELVSRQPDSPSIMPHEAIEYVMAYSGELFDPKMVELFVRQVPLYPTGVTVKLNSGEVGIVSDSNLGYVGRPTVRICYDEGGRPLREPYDLSLAQQGNQGRMVVQVVD